jgi:NAD(P)-dependent dehydrogenase (short-subunit alcohol dehydrogenase family)
MSRVFITGSAGGLGRGAAAALLDQGHDVVIHARSPSRLEDARDLVERGATTVVGDLSIAGDTREVAEQVNALGRMDAVIHNAAVYRGREILAVNVVAPYLLTALIERPARLVYLSSGMHKGGRAALHALEDGNTTYSDSKLFVTTLAVAIAGRWPDVLSNAVDPGWVPTRMGGANAPDDLELGHVTQVWLAVSADSAARKSGGYWYHQREREPYEAVLDRRFQDELLEALERITGVSLP